MNSTYDMHDIVLYDHQGVLKSAIVVKIIIVSGSILYELDSQVTVLEENIIILLGNAKRISEDHYGKDTNNLPE